MDHNRDAGELSQGSTDDEGDSTPAIVLNTQSNLFTFTVSVRTHKLNKQKESAGKSTFFDGTPRDNNSFKIRLLLYSTNRIKWKSSQQARFYNLYGVA